LRGTFRFRSAKDLEPALELPEDLGYIERATPEISLGKASALPSSTRRLPPPSNVVGRML
jgi:hypothetical protein